MKITDTAIVEAVAPIEAAKLAIVDFFKAEFANSYIKKLHQEDEFVFKSVVIDNSSEYYTYINDNYFITSKLGAGLYRVEYCHRTKSTIKDVD